MFKVFSGAWRGLGKTEEVLFMQIGFEFRSLLKHFKGAALSAFMCIVLHSDQNGKSHPGYEVIQAETGLSRDSISGALNYLTSLSIDGQRVMLRYRIRNKKTKAFIGSNHYIVFPTPEQIAQFDGQVEWFDPEVQSQSPIFPTSAKQTGNRPDEADPKSDFSDVGKPDLKNNHIVKKKKHMAEPQSASDLGANAPAREIPVLVQERVEAFPQDCREGARLMFEKFGLIPPEKPAPGEKGGDFALWINSIRELSRLAVEYNTPLARAFELTRARWNLAPFSVAHPGALKRVMTSVLAMDVSKRSKRTREQQAPTAESGSNFVPNPLPRPASLPPSKPKSNKRRK
jgi:hypothetical protein